MPYWLRGWFLKLCMLYQYRDSCLQHCFPYPNQICLLKHVCLINTEMGVYNILCLMDSYIQYINMPIVNFVTQNINLQLGTTVLGLGHALSIQYFLFHFIDVHGGVRYLPCDVKKNRPCSYNNHDFIWYTGPQWDIFAIMRLSQTFL